VTTGTRRWSRATTTEGPTRVEDSRRASVVGQLFDGVLRSAAMHLCNGEEPLAAEVWASGLLAVWDDGLGQDGDDAAEADSPVPSGPEHGRQRAFCEALIRHARAQGTPEAMAVLMAIAAVAPARPATKARTAAAGLARKGVPAPGWADEVGRAVPTEAWVGRDVYGDQEILIVGYAYPGGSEHSLCVLVDHNLAGAAKDAYPAGALADTLARWKEAESSGITLAPVSLADLSGRAADALMATDYHPEAEAGRRLTELRALLATRLGSLPTGASAGQPELGSEARERLVAEFLSSPEAADLLAEPSAVVVCHSLVAYRCDYGDGDPFRWSPTVAAVCLLDHFPAKVTLDGPDLFIVPDVLCGWVRFAGRKRGLPHGAVGRTLDTVVACRDDFAAAMADESRFGPAKRVAMEMLAEGIDLTDEVAVSEWVAAYSGRSASSV